MFGFDIADILMNIPITLLSLTVHECAHGLVSYKLGDPTPKYQGRITLNPLVHLDLVGTLLMILTGFGWAKPVQVNPRYYKNMKRGMALVSIAGPLSNFLLALIGMLLYGAFLIIAYLLSNIDLMNSFIRTFFVRLIGLNVGLMVFNLIPIPPLDGSKVLGMFIPNNVYYQLMQYERYCIFFVMFLSLTGMLDRILGFGINFITKLLTLPVLYIVGIIMSII